jgi:hypothetical protein
MNNAPEAVPYQGPVFNPRNGKEDYFFYVTSIPALSTVVPVAQSLIQLDADSYFLWIATTYQASIAAAALTEATNVIPLANVQIQDGGSGKYLSNAPMPLSCIAGDGKRPYRLIGPRVLAPSATINFNWTNAVAAGTSYAITLILHGIKRYL